MAKDTLVITERGTGQTTRAEDINIPDLWHIAMAQKNPAAKQAIIDTWHIAHAMKRHIIEGGADEQVKTV